MLRSGHKSHLEALDKAPLGKNIMKIAARFLLVSCLAAFVKAGDVGGDGDCKVGNQASLDEGLTVDSIDDPDTNQL